jgi:hypothetical protein
MFGRSSFVALACLVIVAAPIVSFAQDAGVSGIPRGPGNAGGLNNSLNDPSGIGNAARIQPLPPPSLAVPVVPSAAAHILAPRISSLVFPCRDPRPGQVDGSNDEHLQGLLAAANSQEREPSSLVRSESLRKIVQ